MKTTFLKKEEVQPKWYTVDATDQVLGRFAVRLANILRGRNKPDYTPHVDSGDFVVVTNADKIRVTGKKADQKYYYHHTQYVSGLKKESYASIKEKHPERIISEAVRRMLPKNRLAQKQLKKLKIFAQPEHSHEAQKPELLTFS